MFYFFSPFLVALGQAFAIVVFFLYDDIHAFAHRRQRVCLTAVFLLIHILLQTLIYNYSAINVTGTLPTLQYIFITLLYYMVFTRLWSGLSLPVCGFISLIFLLTDNCVWPLLVSISRSFWGISYLYEGRYLLRLPSIVLLWCMECGCMILIRRLLPPLPEIHLDICTSILTVTSAIPFFYIRLFSGQFAMQTNKALQIIMTVCCLVALITIVGGIGRSFNEYEKLRSVQMEHMLQCQQQQFQQKLQDIDAVNRKYHDMKNILLFLKAQNNTREVQEQIQTILNDIHSYEFTAITGNDAIDILLNEKLAACHEKEITCVPYINGSLLSFVEPLDLCTIFGNAMDNAIESCEKITEKSSRQISIRTARKGSSVALVFRNTFARRPELQSGLPVTTKEDKKNHGYGLGNIRYIMNKYQGEMSCRIEGEEFVLTLLFTCVPESA